MLDFFPAKNKKSAARLMYAADSEYRENIFLFLAPLVLDKNTCLSRRPRRREPKSVADAISASFQMRAQQSGPHLKRVDFVDTLKQPFLRRLF